MDDHFMAPYNEPPTMTHSQAKEQLKSGEGIPVEAIFGFATTILNWVTELIANRSTLRARVSNLERICAEQAKQIKRHEEILMSLAGVNTN